MSTVRRPGVLAALLAGVLLLLGGCGLPIDDDVQAPPGEVEPEQIDRGPIQVLPPGPQPGATPTGVVQGFLRAQISGVDDHGIARSFLAAEQRAGWQDREQVSVYAPGSRREAVEEVDGEAVVRVTYEQVGEVGSDGAARVRVGREQTDLYRLRRGPTGDWQLVEVPAGLTLSSQDRALALTPYEVFFLAPDAAPGTDQHLVPDRVLLPTGSGPQALVEQLLDGPSAGLRDSVRTAVPAGAALVRTVEQDPSGEVTVDLSGELRALPGLQRRALSAQLVWTLRQVPDLLRVQLLVEGEPFEVQGDEAPQRLDAWQDFDPEGPGRGDDATALLDGTVQALPADRPAASPYAALAGLTDVLDAAVDPRTDAVAAVTGQDGGSTTLRTGRPGTPVTVAASGAPLRSPTWGSGAYGLWLLRTGDDPAVLTLDEGRVERVPVQGLPALGGSPTLRVSLDGARVALVTGSGALWVGRVRPDVDGGAPSVVDLNELRQTGTLDVSWVDGTELAVLVDDPVDPLRRLAVDGTEQTQAALLVVDARPVSIAASGDRPVLVGTEDEDGAPTTYGGEPGGAFTSALEGGRRPRYPG